MNFGVFQALAELAELAVGQARQGDKVFLLAASEEVRNQMVNALLSRKQEGDSVHGNSMTYGKGLVVMANLGDAAPEDPFVLGVCSYEGFVTEDFKKLGPWRSKAKQVLA